jgi:crossover junction endonuclease EME1
MTRQNRSISGSVGWRRKVTTEWNNELGGYVPIPERIQEEFYVLIYLNIDEFTKIVGEKALHDYWDNIRDAFPKKKLVFLVEGLNDYLRKRKSQHNRALNRAIRSAFDEKANDGGSKRKAVTTNIGPDESALEEAFIWLQVVARCLIVHTDNLEETAAMIGTLTTDIATIPYKYVVSAVVLTNSPFHSLRSL